MKNWLFLIVFFWVSCFKKDPTQLDFFYLHNQGAYLPVWVKGNLNADNILIIIHGGPGGNDGVYMHSKGIRLLEKDNLIIYYDQRGSGASQSSALKDFDADTHIDDLEKLVALIDHKYGKNKKINLLGHSWGGMLGSLYLQKGRNKNRISKWIMSDGAYETINGAEYRALESKALEQIAQGNSISFWQDKVLSTLKNLDTNRLSILDLSKINALSYQGESTLVNDRVISASQGFDAYNYYYNSAHHPAIYALNELFINTLMFRKAYKSNLNILDQIDQLTTPTCLFWGRHDLVVAAEGLELLKQKIPNIIFSFYFEASGHSPMLSEPENFSELVNICLEQ